MMFCGCCGDTISYTGGCMSCVGGTYCSCGTKLTCYCGRSLPHTCLNITTVSRTFVNGVEVDLKLNAVPTLISPAEQIRDVQDRVHELVDELPSFTAHAHGMGQEDMIRRISSWLASRGHRDLAGELFSGKWASESEAA